MVPVAGQTGDADDVVELGQVEELGHRAADPNRVAGVDRADAVVEHEDALGGGVVAVEVGRLLLHEEAAQLGAAFEVTGDDALDLADAADIGAGEARSLNVVDQCRRVVADADRVGERR